MQKQMLSKIVQLVNPQNCSRCPFRYIAYIPKIVVSSSNHSEDQLLDLFQIVKDNHYNIDRHVRSIAESIQLNQAVTMGEMDKVKQFIEKGVIINYKNSNRDDHEEELVNFIKNGKIWLELNATPANVF